MFNLYENIKALCEAHGYSVSRMCELAEISKSTLSNLRNGRSETITPATARKIAAFLGVSMDDVLHGTKKDLPFIANSKPVEFDVDRLKANYDDGLTDSQRDLISLIYELPDDVVLMLLSAAKEWLKNHKSADSAE